MTMQQVVTNLSDGGSTVLAVGIATGDKFLVLFKNGNTYYVCSYEKEGEYMDNNIFSLGKNENKSRAAWKCYTERLLELHK